MTTLNVNFTHNFCESRIYGKPEIVNSFTSLFISILPFFYGFPRSKSLRRIFYILIFNGFSSCYYHYYLNWFGKHLDEISMILATYVGIYKLVLFFPWRDKFPLFLLDLYFLLMLSINTIPEYDILFPFLFAINIFSLLYLIVELEKILPIGNKCLFISLIGFIFWLISEIFCNEYLYLGHAVWHILFPLGFLQYIYNLDMAIPKLNEYKKKTFKIKNE